MNNNVHPVAAALIILISIVTLSSWLWFTGEAKTLGGPSELSVAPNGHLYIQIQNQLIEHDPFGTFVASHDLNDFDIETVIGGIGFFSNGDLLIRRGQDSRSLIDTVRAFMRVTNQASLVPDAPDTGLYRCSLRSKNCNVFGQERFDFKSAFSVFVDPHTDDVYVSDTSRHLIRKYDNDGHATAGPVAGFRFPNQLLMHEGKLLIADTNNHRIQIVDPKTTRFGESISNAKVIPPDAVTNGQRWPNHFVRVRDEWWVNNMSSDMDYGGIYVFDSEWNYLRRIRLPERADPIALIVFNNEVLISDWYGDRVHRISLEGEHLGDFDSAGLTAVVLDSTAQRRHFNLLAWLTAFVGIVLLVALAVKGTDWSPSTEATSESLAKSSNLNETLVLKPDPTNVKKIQSNLVLARLLLIPFAIAMPVMLFFVELPFNTLHLLFVSVILVAILLLAERMIRTNLATSIRISKNRIVILDHTGHETNATHDSVFFSDSYIAADGAAVFFGHLNTPIYNKEHVLGELSRRLGSAQKISAWTMQKKLVTMRHPQGLITVVSIVLMFAIALFELLR